VGDDEPCLVEDAQVLGDADARHVATGRERHERLAILQEQRIEQRAPRGSARARNTNSTPATTGNDVVTCQGLRLDRDCRRWTPRSM
jgi:hypothetical protein